MKKHSVGTLVTMVVACIFAVCILLTLVFGVRVYRTVAEDTSAAYDSNIGWSYITQKVRAYDSAGLLEAGTFGGQDALLFYEEYDGVTYQTALYVYDGWLYELYCEAELAFAPEDGEKLLEAKAMTVSAQGDILHIGFTSPSGQTVNGVLAVRAGGVQ